MEDGSGFLDCLIFLTISVHLSSADTHSLQFLYTTLTSGTNFPEFIALGLLDGEQFVYYDSKIRKMIPKTEWIQKISADDRHYWNRETQRMQDHQERYKNSVNLAVKSFNHTEGGIVLQRMYGCELGDDGTTRGYDQYGYDGEDFISLNLNTGTWTTDKPQAEIFINQWDPTGAEGQYWKSYLKGDCIDWLKKYMVFSRETLERKDPPTASVFQKHSPSPEVVCHATGFFPKELMISWRKDGGDMEEDVELRETLPNQDGSFQKRIILKVPAEDLQKHNYTCVIQHSSLKEEMVLHVNKKKITIVTHSLQFLYTYYTPGIHFPEFTAVVLVDGEQVVYYESDNRKMIPKTEWIKKISVDDPHYWNRETERIQNEEVDIHHLLDTAMKNDSNKGYHTFQRMYGCELHDDGTTRGYDEYGYDGEDFISLNLNTGTWTADNDKAEITKKKWDNLPGFTVGQKNYLEKECIEWLEQFVSYGRETLERKDPPTASVFLKHSPSPEVVCHATGFFPKELMISWRKDGGDMEEDVELSETLPNQDGSFQKRIILKVPAEDLQKHKYTCVIQHSSLKEEMVLEVPKGGESGGGLISIIVGVLVTLIVLVVAGILVWKKKNSGFRPAPSSEGDSSYDKYKKETASSFVELRDLRHDDVYRVIPI